MAKSITVYTTATCGYCRMLKKYLEDNNFPFKEKRVDLSQDDAQEMVSLSGQMGVPFTVISDDKGNQEGVLGFDVQRIQQALLS